MKNTQELTPQQIKIGGAVVLIIGLACLLGTFLAWQATDRIVIISLACGIVCVPGGILMMVTGKIPGQK
jgi:hypothetical protein